MLGEHRHRLLDAAAPTAIGSRAGTETRTEASAECPTRARTCGLTLLTDGGPDPVTPVAQADPRVPAEASTDAHTSLSLLNAFELRCDGQSVAVPISAQRLLAFLALHERPLLRRTQGRRARLCDEHPLSDEAELGSAASMTLLADVVTASKQVTETSSRSRKIAILAELLARLEPDEVAIATGFLSGMPRQGRVGIGYSTIYGAECAPAAEPSLTVVEADRAITDVQAA